MSELRGDYKEYEQLPDFVNVQPGQVRTAVFPKNPGIGTKHISGYPAVGLFWKNGAVMTVIPAIPAGSEHTALDSGINGCVNLMKKFKEEYEAVGHTDEQKSGVFPVMCFEGVLLSHFEPKVRETLMEMGFNDVKKWLFDHLKDTGAGHDGKKNKNTIIAAHGLGRGLEFGDTLSIGLHGLEIHKISLS